MYDFSDLPKMNLVDDDPEPIHIPPDAINTTMGIETVGNKIYYYGFIDADRILKLTKILEMKAQELRLQYFDENPPPIKLQIQSLGGDLFASLGIMDTIRGLGVPIHTIINGAAASGATFMSLVGTKRLMTKHSFVMIHQLSGGMVGDFDELHDEYSNAQKFMKIIKSVYAEYTTIDIDKLDEVLKHDLYFSSEQCLEYGIVDQVI